MSAKPYQIKGKADITSSLKVQVSSYVISSNSSETITVAFSQGGSSIAFTMKKEDAQEFAQTLFVASGGTIQN